MTSTATNARPQVGLMLSCGEPPTTARGYPKKLDWIRPKAGQLGQFSEAAAAFTERYGDRPTSVDVIVVSDTVTEVLDVRPKVWGQSGLKAIGKDNLAFHPPGLFGDSVRAFDWELITFPDDSPESGRYVVEGRDDKAVTKLGLKVYGTLRVSIPGVTGLMMVAEISTTSVRSMENWHNALHLASRLTGGVLVGIPFRLALRKARARYWDEKEKKRKATEFNEWVLESRHAIPEEALEELYAIAAKRHRALAAGSDAQRLALPPVRHDDRERDEELVGSLVPDEDEQVEDATDVEFVAIREPAEQTEEAAPLFQAPASVANRETGE